MEMQLLIKALKMSKKSVQIEFEFRTGEIKEISETLYSLVNQDLTTSEITSVISARNNNDTK